MQPMLPASQTSQLNQPKANIQQPIAKQPLSVVLSKIGYHDFEETKGSLILEDLRKLLE